MLVAIGIEMQTLIHKWNYYGVSVGMMIIIKCPFCPPTKVLLFSFDDGTRIADSFATSILSLVSTSFYFFHNDAIKY